MSNNNDIFNNLYADTAIIVQDFSKTTVIRFDGSRYIKTVLRFVNEPVLEPAQILTEDEARRYVDTDAVAFSIEDMSVKVTDRRNHFKLSWADAVDQIIALESREAYSDIDDDDLAAEIRMEQLFC